MTGVELIDVRNYAALNFSPQAGLNVFLGKNAQGKSNLLEAIAMLGTGKSFRTSHEADLIRRGRPGATITGEAHVAAGSVRLACSLTATSAGARKTYTVNGERVRYTSFLGRARVVTFTPTDLHLIGGAPALRRSILNAALAQESSTYYRLLADYGRTLDQKNALLRGVVAPDEGLLATYDERLVELGTPLILERRRYVTALAEVARAVAARWVDAPLEGDLEMSYQPDVTFEDATEDAVRHAFRARLQARRAAEHTRAQALVGPHRDDLVFRLAGRSLSAFGSQGEQRTAVLALKVAEYTVMRARGGEAPLLLLDDVLSELDSSRQAAFLESLGTVEQAFITSAGTLPPAPVAASYSIAAATLTRVS